jgi:predicted N-acetyltransferase YhbS
VPVVVLGRLAVDRSVQGEKLGRELLKDAFRRALIVSEQVGCYAVCVRALNEKAADFYAKFGFIPFVNDPLQLYLPLATIRAAATAEG